MSVVEDSFEYLDAPVERIAGADVPMPYAANLERMAVPQVRTSPFAFIYVCIRICGYTILVAGLVALQEKKKKYCCAEIPVLLHTLIYCDLHCVQSMFGLQYSTW